MRLEIIQAIRTVIIALLVYVPTTAFSGWFTAWTAKRCDDDLPERLGFLTLDPFAHFSIFGFALLLIGQLFGEYLVFLKGVPGFGRFIILDPQQTVKKANVILEFFARCIAHFLMMTCAIIVLFFLFKGVVFLPVSFVGKNAHSLWIVSKDILMFFLYQNMALCQIFFLFGLADIICFFSNIQRMFSVEYFIVLLSTLLILETFVSDIFRYYAIGLNGLLILLFQG